MNRRRLSWYDEDDHIPPPPWPILLGIVLVLAFGLFAVWMLLANAPMVAR